MKCNKCDGEMTQLLTSFFCPKCEGDTPSNPANNAAINKLTKKKCGCDWESDCDCHTRGGCGGCHSKSGGASTIQGPSLHSSAKEEYILYGPIKSISQYPPGGSHEFVFEYYAVMVSRTLLKKIIHKDDLLSLSIGRINALINTSFDISGYNLYYQVHTKKFCISGPGWSWNSKLGKWDYFTTNLTGGK